MAIGFVIPAGSIVSSPAHPAANTTIRPDKSLKRISKPKVHIAKFGDGYEQRLVDGINSIEESFNVVFSNRTRTEIDDIIFFLDSKKGVTAFNFTIPNSNVDIANFPDGTHETTIKVVCDGFDITYDHGDFYSASAKFRRVYEA